MISKNDKYIFIQIPKTGSDSIMHFFFKIHGITEASKNLYPDFFCNLCHHAKIKQIQTRIDTDDFLKFTFVRNPFDRAVSEYLYCKKHNGCYLQSADLFNKLFKDFNDFVKKNGFRTASWPMHEDSQYSFIEGADIDFIGRFENLQEHFSTLCRKLNIQNHTLPHKNKSSRTRYKDYYNQESIDIISKKYKKDIKYFGYDF